MDNNGNGIQYFSDVWFLEDNLACRKSKETNKIIKVPVTEEIMAQIEKQEVAEKELKRLLRTTNTDNKIIGKLWAFLDEYINYISYESKINLLTKMKEIEMIDGIDINNSSFIHSLSNFLLQNNMEDFYDTLDQFFDFNLQNIKEMAFTDSSFLATVLNIQEPDFS